MKTRLVTGKYPQADPYVWLIGMWKDLDPEFCHRLAAFSRDKEEQSHINGNPYRSYAVQNEYYQEYLVYKKTKKLGKRGIKLAAKPGSSAHEYRLAVDILIGSPLYEATNAELAKYGLCKPLIKKGEVWHIQPIETNTTSSAVFRKYAPIMG